MQLITKAIEKKLPALYAQDGKGMEATVHVKFFCGPATWYITEFDGKDTFFGWCDLGHGPGMAELGYVSKSELESLRMRASVASIGVERDLHFTPQTLEDCINKNA